MAKHTPGPWEQIEQYVYAENSEGDSEVVAEVWLDRGASETQAVQHANARLIAAAPDLLEALLLARTEMIESGNWYARDQGWTPACTAVDAAIAKATGDE